MEKLRKQTALDEKTLEGSEQSTGEHREEALPGASGGNAENEWLIRAGL